jgi:cytoskeletal protein RodZ
VGEIEMALGNRQLLSIFFIVVALLGIFFTVGYIVGKSTSPVLADSSRKGASPLIVNSIAPPSQVTPPKTDEVKPPKKEAASHQAPSAAAEASRPQEKSAPHPTPSVEAVKAAAAAQQPAKKETAKNEPPKTESPKNEEPQSKGASHMDPGTALASGRSYLQLTATTKPDADKMVDVLRQKGFSTVAVEIRERPGTWRVLVGPVNDSGANLRGDLQKMGFPGNDALRRTF